MLVRCAWQCDDAYITYRTVWNLWHGYGLTWNPVERVQAYTHPLWMGVGALCLGLFRELYFSTLVASTLLVMGALAAHAFRENASARGLLIPVLFVSSKAAVDYAACGLETPLAYALLSGFVLLVKREGTARSVFAASLTAGLLLLTRPDSILMTGPALGLLFWTAPGKGRAWRELGAGLIPWLLWEGFSLAYYGFLFPNTAYAKLNLHIPAGELARHGLAYLMDSLGRDPLTLLTILFAVTFAMARGGAMDRALGGGILLSLLYIVRIGGDFMAGRFLAPLFLVALVMVDAFPFARTRRVAFPATAILAALLAAPGSNLWSGRSHGQGLPQALKVERTGIADERSFYYPQTGLLPVMAAGSSSFPQALLRAKQAQVEAHRDGAVTADQIGFLGYFAGPQVHIVDAWALADPLLAHLPFVPFPGWRVGHYERRIPAGYLETVTSSENRIRDGRIAKYYDDIRLVTRGALFSPARWAAIARLNCGLDQTLVHEDYL